MTGYISWLGFALALFVGPGSVDGSAGPAPTPGARVSLQRLSEAADTIQEGRDPAVIFSQLCTVCHGDEGEGDGPVAGAMVPQPANLTDPERIGARTDEQLVEVLTNGKGPMPSFKTVLEPGEIRAMVSYIRELSGTESEPDSGGTR